MYHQLGMVLQEQAGRASGEERQALLEEAAAAYKDSLQIEESVGDWQGAAQTALQLAQLEESAGRLASAERWTRKALESFDELGYRRGYGNAANNLAVLLRNIHRLPADDPRRAGFAGRDLLAEAEEWARTSLEIKESIDDPSTAIWKTYGILAAIARDRGD